MLEFDKRIVMKDFELIPHTADIKIRVYGKDLQQLFTHALTAMFTIMRPNTRQCTYKSDRLVCDALPIHRTATISSPDTESLLVDFLSYALYLSDVHNEAYLNMQVSNMNNTSINAVLMGIAVDGFEQSEVKAVTYHDLKIVMKDGLLQTDIVFDI